MTKHIGIGTAEFKKESKAVQEQARLANLVKRSQDVAEDVDVKQQKSKASKLKKRKAAGSKLKKLATTKTQKFNSIQFSKLHSGGLAILTDLIVRGVIHDVGSIQVVLWVAAHQDDPDVFGMDPSDIPSAATDWFRTLDVGEWKDYVAVYSDIVADINNIAFSDEVVDDQGKAKKARA